MLFKLETRAVIKMQRIGIKRQINIIQLQTFEEVNIVF